MINQAQNKRLHALLSELGWMEQKKDLVSGFTQGRTVSSAEMSYDECQQLISHLAAEKNAICKKMRGKLIHYLCLQGYTTPFGEPDMIRINERVKGIGSRNPHRKALSYLSPAELRQVLNQIELIYKKTLQR